MVIRVRPVHIEQGEPGMSDGCPVALACLEALEAQGYLGYQVYVGYNGISVLKPGANRRFRQDNQPHVTGWLDVYDEQETSFLDLPELEFELEFESWVNEAAAGAESAI